MQRRQVRRDSRRLDRGVCQFGDECSRKICPGQPWARCKICLKRIQQIAERSGRQFVFPVGETACLQALQQVSNLATNVFRIALCVKESQPAASRRADRLS